MVYLILALGLLFIFIEFFIPGAIMGILGSILIISSMVIFASESSSPLAIVAYIIGVAISVGLLIKFALSRILKTKSKNSFYSDDAQEGFKASHYDPTAIGKTGLVLTDLKPGGYIVIEGKQHAALSITGYIPRGSKVLVTGGQEESLIVQSISKE